MQGTTLLNDSVDISQEFNRIENTFFFGMNVVGSRVEEEDRKLRFERFGRKSRISFNQAELAFEPTRSWEFPVEYTESPELPFSISFVSNRTVRIRMKSRAGKFDQVPSLMIPETIPSDTSWKQVMRENEVEWVSDAGSVILQMNPFHLIFKDTSGKILTQTYHMQDNLSLVNTKIPFSFVRSNADMQTTIAASFTLSPQEKIYGCGESFTALNKRGQKINLWTKDAFGAQTPYMYKPVPFFMSSRGYGMFIHSSAAITLDFGQTYDEINSIYLNDEELDLFFFLGEPQQLLSEYTALTGRSPVPPLWSFGLWMSRITYESETEVREVAHKLRNHHIPCDVIHLDTGWFETDWRCNYEFAPSRFENPDQMIADLREQGFQISLWQLPYFTPNNEYYQEIIDRGFAVKNLSGGWPTEDAILDFSNPEAVTWYKEKIAGLLKKGVSAIKVDFGEAAPIHGMYHSGKSGLLEHNLYPLRYNKAVGDITKEITGESIIWARSAWAGSQRYPLHWGGDAENTNSAMAATLRAGLSLGLCGFTFWSHDIGGFVHRSPEELYRRWMPFGMLTSHSRCHGAPPKEPWEYSEEFMNDFRSATELKYRLMPYIYTQAHLCSQQGLPMMQTLFLQNPKDPNAWLIDDAYMFGSDILVAPLFESDNERKVYVPEGMWIDFQTDQTYAGGKWYDIEAGTIPIIILVRSGSIIPQVKPAAHTRAIDWNEVDFKIYKANGQESCEGNYYHLIEQRMYKVQWVDNKVQLI
ncbi:glycoside hydrolase family 31 protein [Paenibacillus sp. LHD-117]|uniref:glycoside hydrolase family 31 protein n=1 Tax=Paenibacillus sp. LHD-117 TaxID=3071412 RepID=UPI0027DED6C3|nr:TIM-barrel domain-containing protein [Paenibacillus sp. LHD-117]MDQ6421455.1 glycoside hydrolase family 31 protein [Paenibacillus sp. LHD-117]